MTKDERDELSSRLQTLDSIQNLLQKGTYPGIAAGELLQCQIWIKDQWSKAQGEIAAEQKRIEDLLNGPKLPLGEVK